MKLHLLSTILCSIFLSSFAWASYNQAPPNFNYQEDQAVFVDFIHSTHELTYNFLTKSVKVDSVIEFESAYEGYPIFDLVSEPLDVYLDGASTSTKLVSSPDSHTAFRVVQHKVRRGSHQLKMSHTFETNVVFDDKGVASAFWLSDLNDRKYLEQYLPSNLEYDQHSRKIKVQLVNFEGRSHVLKTNGKVTQLSDNSFEIVYPPSYTSSSIFFHLFPEQSKVSNVQFYYPSIDGRMIPVDIYTIVDINPFVELTKTLLAELEADYGAFPHDQLVIYGNSMVKGGMEYSGATSTGLLSLGHELFHSYNARGVMPANGNAGWMDEAMARWRDNGYPLKRKLSFDSSRLGGHSVWNRSTDRMSYTEGSAFLSMIAYRMNEKGLSLKQFLAEYFKRNMFSTVTTQQFEAEIAEASELDLSEDFNRYIYGKYSSRKSKSFYFHEEDPHHPKYSKEELLRMTMP
jgi:hypothetical protein